MIFIVCVETKDPEDTGHLKRMFPLFISCYPDILKHVPIGGIYVSQEYI